MYKKLLFNLALAMLLTINLHAQLHNLLHQFSFDGSGANTTNTINFTATGGLYYAADRFNNANSALSLGGGGATAIIPNLPYGASARSVSVWVRLTFFAGGSSVPNHVYNYGTTSSSSVGYFTTTSAAHYSTTANMHGQTTANHSINTWYHYVFTYDGTKSRIYRNGVLLGTKAVPFNTVNNGDLFRLGLTEAGASNYFLGAMDDLQIYSRALSASEVFHLYGGTQATPNIQFTFTGNTSDALGTSTFSTPSGTGLNNDRFNTANRALYMNNSGSVLSGAWSANTPTGNNARTISFWFKRSQSDFQELFVYGASGANNCFGLYVTANGSFVNYITQNSTTYTNMSFSSNQSIVPDSWHHITVVYTQDSSKIYRNGVQIGAAEFAGTLTTGSTNFLLGKVLTTSQNPFQGTIDEIKIYNVALSPAEIANQYTTTLPLIMGYFTGQLKNNKALLNWTSLSEQNTSHFDIEYSNNGNDFTKVHSVNAAGNSNTTKQYSYEHSINNAAVHYYRLKMTDKDGSFTYSNVVKLNNNKTVKTEVYPTVTSTTLNVNITAEQHKVATLQIISSDGRVLQQQTLNLQQGTQNKTLNVSQLQNGMYFLIIKDNQNTERFSFIKQ